MFNFTSLLARAREKRNHVISIFCSVIDLSLRPISAREITQLLFILEQVCYTWKSIDNGEKEWGYTKPANILSFSVFRNSLSIHFTNFVFEMLVDQINVNNNLVKGAKITKEPTIVKSAKSYLERNFFNQEFYYQG